MKHIQYITYIKPVLVRNNNGRTHKKEESSNPINLISHPILKRSGTPLQSSAPPLLVVSSETLQHFLYFFPLPQWHGWLGLGFFAGILCLFLCLDRALPLAETLRTYRSANIMFCSSMWWSMSVWSTGEECSQRARSTILRG